jgi:hypothetical protein
MGFSNVAGDGGVILSGDLGTMSRYLPPSLFIRGGESLFLFIVTRLEIAKTWKNPRITIIRYYITPLFP